MKTSTTKRGLMLLLSVLMVLSLVTPAFALNGYGDGKMNITDEMYYYDEDDNILRRAPYNWVWEPGDTIFFLLDVDPALTSTQRNRYKVLMDYNVGKDTVDSVSIVSRKANIVGTGTGYTASATVNGFSGGFASLNGPYSFTSPSTTTLDLQSKLSDAIKSHSSYTTVKSAYKLANYAQGGYSLSGSYYTADGLKTHLSLVSVASDTYNKGGTYYTEGEAISDAGAAIFTSLPGYVRNDKYYVNLLGAGITDYAMNGLVISPSSATYYDNNTAGLSAAITAALLAYPDLKECASNTVYSDNLGAVSNYSAVPAAGFTQVITGWYNATEEEVYDVSDAGMLAALISVGYTTNTTTPLYYDGTTYHTSLADAGVSSAAGGYADGDTNGSNYFTTHKGILNHLGYASNSASSLHIGNVYYADFNSAISLLGVTPNSSIWYRTSDEYYFSSSNVDDDVTAKVDAIINGVAGSVSSFTTTPNSTTTTKYNYFAAVKLKSTSTTKVRDLYAEIAVANVNANTARNSGYFISFGVEIQNLKYDGGNAVSGYISIGSGEGAVVKFDDDAGEVEIEFGNSGELALFAGNMNNQSDVNLSYSTAYNADFADEHNYANLDFISWTAKPSFNRIGQLYIFADRNTYLYEVTADGYKEVNATYDRDYEAWTFKTRTLGSYVVSDRALKAAPTSSVTPTAPTPGTKPNPPTGRA